MPNVLVFDFETTGIDTKSCGVVQSSIAIATINEDGSYTINDIETRLLNPECEINPLASEVHGIYADDVKDCVKCSDYLTERFSKVTEDAIMGYNSNSFDIKIAKRFGLQTEGKRKLDLIVATRKLKSLKVINKATLSAAYEDLTGLSADNAHEAEADVRMTLSLIKPTMRLLGYQTFSEFCDFLESNINTMPFGKHVGKKFSEIPTSYLRWLVELPEVSDEIIKLANKELEVR